METVHEISGQHSLDVEPSVAAVEVSVVEISVRGVRWQRGIFRMLPSQNIHLF